MTEPRCKTTGRGFLGERRSGISFGAASTLAEDWEITVQGEQGVGLALEMWAWGLDVKAWDTQTSRM